ncbi:MAG: DUF3572 domain-containing protein [Roseobacter sp.]
MTKQQEAAEATALEILTWLTANDELLSVFQGSTGLSESDIRTGVHDPIFLGMVLDFVMMDDKWVIEACDARTLSYDSLLAARRALPGGSETHWT